MSNIMTPPPEYSAPPVPDTENKPSLPPFSSKEQERLNRHQQKGRKRLIKGTGFVEKDLWDWLMLIGVLAIPIAVAFGTLLISLQQTQSSQQASERQHQTDIQIANDQQQESTLQIYLDHMSDLLLNHQLLASKHSGDEVRDVARIWTLTTLRRLDPTRKIVVLKFLYEAGLIGGYDSTNGSGKRLDAIVALNDADLSGVKLGGANLSYIILSGANLREADLSQADLSQADLSGADLSDGADLNGATLSGADLNGATLSGANLGGATLSGANLGGATLSGANLRDTTLIEADLSQADLSRADLSSADLSYAHLKSVLLYKANLNGANLSYADLSKANLNGANLSYANLGGADLGQADLSDANLRGAQDLTQEQLDKAKTLTGATMPDGSNHP
ncbi:MAG TPA: pentapeptide repeat-containing protein [Ktedonobacteraceae bacterium]